MRAKAFARALVAVVITAAGTVVTTAAPALAGNSCPSSDPLVVSASGTVTATDPDWWSFSSPYGATITLVPTSGDPDMQVVSASCGSIVCYPYQGGTETCTVPPGPLNVGVLHYSGPGGASSYTLSVTYPQCGDGIDNDGDGWTDHPSDPGCTGPDDQSEGVPCSTKSGVTVCAGLEPGEEILGFPVEQVHLIPGPGVRVVGRVDLYRFTLPGGTVVNLPCVVLGVDATAVNPCATAGGQYVSLIAWLVDRTEQTPTLERDGELMYVAVCRAELVATVNGVGVQSAEALTVCPRMGQSDPH